MKILGVTVRLGSAAVAVLITIAGMYILRVISYIHVGEPRAAYNVYFRVCLGISTWLLLFVSGFLTDPRPIEHLPDTFRAAAKGIGVGYIAGLVAYVLMIFLMVAIDRRSFGPPKLDIDSIVPFFAQPLTSFAWVFGALAALVYHWIMIPLRTRLLS